MADRYDAVTSRKDKDGKTRYTKIGVMFPSRDSDGFSVKLEALPLPNDKGEVWINMFVPRERDDDGGRQQTRGGQKQQQPSSRDMDDDIQF